MPREAGKRTFHEVPAAPPPRTATAKWLAMTPGHVYATILVALLTLAILMPTAAGAADTERISVSTEGTQANASSGSYQLSTSADGRYVVFSSSASNLVPGDTNGSRDVFLRDTQTNTTTRVSAGASDQAISADGRYVVFRGFDDAYDRVFLRDTLAGTTERVDISTQGGPTDVTTRGLGGPTISADGRYVSFLSRARLVAGETSSVRDVFVRDRQGGTTERVSVSSAEVEANRDSDRAVISADGRYVAFSSSASNLVTGDTNRQRDIFVRDRQSGTTTRVKVTGNNAQVTGGGDGGNAYSLSPSISADGQYVAFVSTGANLPGGGNGRTRIYLRDTKAGTTERIDVLAAADAPERRYNFHPSVSADGRYVAFTSSSLVPGDPNTRFDVFVRDRQTNSTERISVQGAGGGSNGNSVGAAISADGRYVTFTSSATNLISGDTNGFSDVFRRLRQGSTPPSPRDRPLKAVEATIVPEDLVVTANGFLVSDAAANRVLQVDAAGLATSLAGSGAPADFAGDGERATVARLAGPAGIAVRPDGRLLVADQGNARVRQVASSRISTLAGNGSRRADPTPASGALSGIGDPLRLAVLGNEVAFTSKGTLGFVGADRRVRLVPTPAGQVFAVAPLGASALLVGIGDTVQVRSANGTYTRVAGGGPAGPGNGDGGPATMARLSGIADVSLGPDGALYIVESTRVRRVGPDQVIQTVAGGGTGSLRATTRAAATALRLQDVRSVAVTATGDLLVADRGQGAVLRVAPDGTATRVAGCGTGSRTCDPVDAARVPQRGRTQYAATVSGVVSVRRPGTKTFKRLGRNQLIPDNSEVDTGAGVVDLSVAQRAQDVRTARLSLGRFFSDQQSRAGGLTSFILSGPLSCTTGSRSRATAARKKGKGKPKKGGLLAQTARGPFATSTKHSNTAVRGTTWKTVQTCASTTSSVREGAVTVRDRVQRLTICLRAGQTYVAFAKPTAAQRRRAAQRASAACRSPR